MQGWIRQYPEEFLSSGKVWRAAMIVIRLTIQALSLSILWVFRPSNIDGELTPLSYYAMVVVGAIAAQIALASQSFLRWMFRNWNARRESYD